MGGGGAGVQQILPFKYPATVMNIAIELSRYARDVIT